SAKAEKIRVGRLGINLDDWENDPQLVAAKQTELLASRMVFLYVGGLHVTKSIDKVIQALHYVLFWGQREDFHFVVVGTGPEYAPLRALAEELIPGHYYFTGFVARVEPFYQVADVVICSRTFSRGEISASIPEAFASGKAVIVPNLGGWGEYIDESRGHLVAKDDELDYAEAIFECLQNPELVKRQGRDSRKYAEERLSWQAQTDFFLSLYSSSGVKSTT